MYIQNSAQIHMLDDEERQDEEVLNKFAHELREKIY